MFYHYKPKVYTLAKKSISEIPFEELAENFSPDKAESFCEKYHIQSCASWLPAQLVAHFGKWTPVKGENGLYSAKATLAKNIHKDNKRELGIYYFALHTKRSKMLSPKQYSKENINYCTLVPLVLSGFKKYQDIPYSSWSKDGLHWIVEKGLYEAMVCEVPEVTVDELLQLRSESLTYKSGARVGTLRPAESSYAPTVPQSSALAALPVLARIMLLQTWCAHPSHRNITSTSACDMSTRITSYMILDPTNWDNVPAPLIDTEIGELKMHDATGGIILPWEQE